MEVTIPLSWQSALLVISSLLQWPLGGPLGPSQLPWLSGCLWWQACGLIIESQGHGQMQAHKKQLLINVYRHSTPFWTIIQLIMTLHRAAGPSNKKKDTCTIQVQAKGRWNFRARENIVLDCSNNDELLVFEHDFPADSIFKHGWGTSRFKYFNAIGSPVDSVLKLGRDTSR